MARLRVKQTGVAGSGLIDSPGRTEAKPRLHAALPRCLLLLLSALFLPSNSLFGQLTLTPGPETRIALNDDALVVGEALSLAEFTEGHGVHPDSPPGWDDIAVLHGGTRRNCVYYRETAVGPDRIELTWYVRFAPYLFGSDFPGHTYNEGTAAYELRFPAALLANARYKALTGNPMKPKWCEDKLDAEQAEGTHIISTVQYLILHLANGQGVTLDLNPLGNHNFGRKTMYAERDWVLLREGNCFVLRARMRRITWGDTRRFKVVFMPSTVPYDHIHSSSKRGSSPMLYPSLRVNCGLAKLKSHVTLGSQPYNAADGIGWVEAPPEPISVGKEKGVHRDAVRGHGESTLRLDAQNGVYLLTMLSGARAEASEALSVSVANGRCLDAPRTAAGQFSARTAALRVKDAHVKLVLNGPSWAISGLSLTPLAYDTEDYLFNRTWFVDQARFDRWFADIEPLPELSLASPPAPVKDPMAWTWNGALTTLEAALDSSRSGLNTPETMRQRLGVLKSGGYRGVVIGGLHFRFNHVDSPRSAVLLRNTRLAVHEAHRLGLKVIDHWDFNWVFATGYPKMLEILARDPSCLQRSFYPLQVSTSFCLNSKAFEEAFVAYLQEHQRVTGIDGHMIDEINWIKGQYCFCDTCRHLFETETGMQLPTDCRTIYNKPSDPIWRGLVTWRGRKTAELQARLLAKARRIHPNVIMMRYTSSFLSRPHPAGLELNRHSPWNVDYAGDEFHPDLVLQNWRVLFARTKSRQGAVASFRNAPTWILPKFRGAPRRTLYAWALGRMNRANIWYRSRDYERSHRLHAWPHQMDDQHARPLSDVAVLLSQPTRELSPDMAYYFEQYMAWTQTLAEANIQYDVILDRDVNESRLSEYAALILPNAAVLSEGQASAIRAYAAAGGRVLATYETGCFTPNGERREEPALADAMGLRFAAGERRPADGRVSCNAEIATGLSQADFEISSPWCPVTLVTPGRSRVLATCGGKPAIVETPYAKGGFLYLAGSFLRQNFEPRAVSARNATTLRGRFSYTVHFNPDLTRLTRNLLNRVAAPRMKTLPLQLPGGVIYTAFQENSEPNRRVVLHLLNCRGKPRLSFGDTIELPADVPQPEVPGELVFRVTGCGPIRQGTITSPDTPTLRPVGVEDAGVDAVRVTVPAGALTNYALVRLFD
ncbi:MAG: hypothetical protein HN976_19510 [Lentisphaerae bacterium]|nr:hypothetical protein [Lentisphaerota bacterium]MBT7057290.1 hypothetical protein [Lentisphaerota bacterium]